MPPFKLCATYLAWKRECHNFIMSHNLTHSPIVSTDSLVEWLINHISAPSKLHQRSDFYDVLADISTRHTTIRISILRQHLTSHEAECPFSITSSRKSSINGSPNSPHLTPLAPPFKLNNQFSHNSPTHYINIYLPRSNGDTFSVPPLPGYNSPLIGLLKTT